MCPVPNKKKHLCTLLCYHYYNEVSRSQHQLAPDDDDDLGVQFDISLYYNALVDTRVRKGAIGHESHDCHMLLTMSAR
uniref:Uncharacterized protein n=1 Tax=Arion vulgaris TaxID=1028688 RepID=A0A0B6Z2D4_9EUPU